MASYMLTHSMVVWWGERKEIDAQRLCALVNNTVNQTAADHFNKVITKVMDSIFLNLIYNIIAEIIKYRKCL